ncbi:flippase [Peristeroidobacter agariperforans]|uniref:flippase n=1 Tax=Peristeroidobacter agariperforans TaxID=268404 RepID=UPI00101CC89E|nr:flippase [Peristeroidobacter agariperforans]
MSSGSSPAIVSTEGAPTGDKSFSRVFAHGVAWNLIGFVLPLPIGLIAFPLLAGQLNEFRFGLLTAVWAITGYFAMFDFGVARALTRELSMADGATDPQHARALTHTATSIALGLGCLGALLLCALSPLLANVMGADGPAARNEIIWTLILTSALLPLLLLITIVQGVLEAMQRFRDLAIMRIPLTTATYVAPLAMLPFDPSVPGIVMALVVARLAILVIFWGRARRMNLPRIGLRAFTSSAARRLLVQGGWMTVTNFVSPILTYLDRWLVVALASVAALGYYSVPVELGQRLLVTAAAIAGVMFPVFAKAGGYSEQALAGYRQSAAASLMSIVPVALVVGMWAGEFFELWMGATFARESAHTLQIIMLGILFNSVARIPFTLLQAAGKAHVTAAIHVFELPFFVALAWALISSYGVVGAAAAWTLRVGADLVLMLVAVGWLSHDLARAGARIGIVTVLAAACYWLGISLDATLARVAALAIGTTLTAGAMWFYLLSTSDRAMILRLIPWRRGAALR